MALSLHGLRFVGKVRGLTTVPIIADLKIVDVCHIAHRIAANAIEAGCDAVTLCGVCGPEVVAFVVREVGSKHIILFTQFTVSTGMISDQIANKVVRYAVDFDLLGVQVPGTRPKRIASVRKIAGEGLMIMSFGIGKQGPDYAQAAKAGADLEIVGRKIIEAKNPLAEAKLARERIVNELRQV